LKEKELVTNIHEEVRALADPESLPGLLEEQVRIRPDSVAVVDGDECLTYRELAGRSRELAAYLRHLGVTPDTCVGVFCEPSIELLPAVWGTLFAGGAYLPLSTDYPDERLRFMIEEAPARVVVAEERLAARLTELAPPGTTIVTLSQAARFTEANRETVDRSAPEPQAQHLAYVIYTSGSTGTPKGVMIEHRSIVSQMRWLRAVQRIDESRTVLQKTPVGFDAAQWEILAPACGSRVVMAGPGAYRDPERLLELIGRHKVTTLQCVPTLLRALLDTEELHHHRSLRQIFCGGEALPRSLAARLVETLPGCELVNLYGPTECSINTSAGRVDPTTVTQGPSTISIGAPVWRTTYHVLDERMTPVGVGEVGELYIGGIQLARGYLNRPDLTAQRFIRDPFDDRPDARLYRTGDLVHRNPDGTVQFIGRTDNQVKLRGYRVELDEIRLAIEAHEWVRQAAVVMALDPRTESQQLAAFVELNPNEAALMDQGNHGAHHQSKEGRLQARAQLANLGCREPGELAGKPVIELPGAEATRDQRRRVFARKTYRFFEGGPVTRDDILRLFADRVDGAAPRDPASLELTELGEILRYFGQYLSTERLLPKYGYASPGSLYATQMYLELHGIAGLTPGYYYYHPVAHRLVLIRTASSAKTPGIRIHFIGKKRAIEPVYKNNIREVLEIESGHMVGLFERVLPGYGLDIRALGYTPVEKEQLECADEDYYLGTFEITGYPAGTGASLDADRTVELYVQSHPGRVADLPAGQYRYRNGELERISDELILKKHVIAINQEVYERSAVGITMLCRGRDDWLSYIDLGRTLQHLQMNDLHLGFMSSGYSSRSGNDLPSARRIESILRACGDAAGPSYFAIGGRVSEEQVRSEGMHEDVVHMRGPAEMIRDDLVNFLPDYMVPSRVTVLDQLPLTVHGKVDLRALTELAEAEAARNDRPYTAPRTDTEHRIAGIWAATMRLESPSVRDDFFATGGNSLIAVKLVNQINKQLGVALPLQILFESPTIEKLAQRVDRERSGGARESDSRLIPLAAGTGDPIYCWPGLGGYPMNLRLLADRVGLGRPFYGIQAYGINVGEEPYSTIRQMAEADVRMIRERQPVGPYLLWGYSFGARVAFEAAYQLEAAGEEVAHLFLIAPGSPLISTTDGSTRETAPTWDNEAYLTILFSVFAASVTDRRLARCLRVTRDEESFAAFISAEFDGLDPELIKRVSRVVARTYSFRYEFPELAERRIKAPVTVFKAQGDDYSFIDQGSGFSAAPPTVVRLDADHYSLLKPEGVNELTALIRRCLHTGTRERSMPHVNIKHFPVSLTDEQQAELIASVTSAVQRAFRCDEEVISIALEPVDADAWHEQVYVPEIVNRKELLRKQPNY
jgi:amino acid adenylation domain-containing protein